MTHLGGIERRHLHIRKRIVGTKERPRLSIYRSIKNLDVQLIDDLSGRTLFGLSSRSPLLKDKGASWGSMKAAQAFGDFFAEEAKKKGFSNVVFDRGGYLYHGRIKAFAEACRKKGLKF